MYGLKCTSHKAQRARAQLQLPRQKLSGFCLIFLPYSQHFPSYSCQLPATAEEEINVLTQPQHGPHLPKGSVSTSALRVSAISTFFFKVFFASCVILFMLRFKTSKYKCRLIAGLCVPSCQRMFLCCEQLQQMSVAVSLACPGQGRVQCCSQHLRGGCASLLVMGKRRKNATSNYVLVLSKARDLRCLLCCNC